MQCRFSSQGLAIPSKRSRMSCPWALLLTESSSPRRICEGWASELCRICQCRRCRWNSYRHVPWPWGDEVSEQNLTNIKLRWIFSSRRLVFGSMFSKPDRPRTFISLSVDGGPEPQWSQHSWADVYRQEICGFYWMIGWPQTPVTGDSDPSPGCTRVLSTMSRWIPSWSISSIDWRTDVLALTTWTWNESHVSLLENRMGAIRWDVAEPITKWQKCALVLSISDFSRIKLQ